MEKHNDKVCNNIRREKMDNYEDWDITNLTEAQANEIVWNNTTRFEVIEDKIIDTSRWSIIHEAIVLDNTTTKFYKTSYSVGATEYQEKNPYEYENPEFIEVKKVPIESYTWEKA